MRKIFLHINMHAQRLSGQTGMYKIRLVMRPLFSAFLLGALALTTAVAADPLVGFGENSATAGKHTLMGPSAPKVQLTETKDSLQIQAPDPWSTIVQFLELSPISLASIKPSDSLTVTVKGSPGGNEPRLRIQIVSPGNWQQWASWEFDLSSVRPDEYTTITADTAFQAPSAKLGETLPANLGTLQIFTLGKSPGPWELEIQSVGTAPAK
jgi:hypothetical protein